jgi:regulator of RNase E activity RraA
MSVPCVVHPASPTPSADLLARLWALSTSLVSDAFGRWAGAPGILPVAGLSAGQVVVGPAHTVRTRPGDNLVVHKAIDLARPGEVLVVAAGGGNDRAILGGLLGAYAASKGLAALVIDGAVRDLSELAEAAPPVFATGVCHLGPYKDGPGEIRGPVAIAGLAVHDGDLVVADEDGVAVIPRAKADEVTDAAEEKLRSEQRERAAIAAGTWDRSWLDTALDLQPPRGE